MLCINTSSIKVEELRLLDVFYLEETTQHINEKFLTFLIKHHNGLLFILLEIVAFILIVTYNQIKKLSFLVHLQR